jgi:hypothetical protein
MKDVNADFKLATAGWVLGPKGDRAGFDKALSKDCFELSNESVFILFPRANNPSNAGTFKPLQTSMTKSFGKKRLGIIRWMLFI